MLIPVLILLLLGLVFVKYWCIEIVLFSFFGEMS